MCCGSRAGSDRLHLGHEGGHEVSRRQGAGKRRPLTGPLGTKARLAGGFAGGVEGLARIVRNRIGRDFTCRDASAECGEAVGESPGGTSRNGSGHHRMIGRIAGQDRPVASIGLRLRAGDKSRAKLDGTRHETQGG